MIGTYLKQENVEENVVDDELSHSVECTEWSEGETLWRDKLKDASSDGTGRDKQGESIQRAVKRQ